MTLDPQHSQVSSMTRSWSCLNLLHIIFLVSTSITPPNTYSLEINRFVFSLFFFTAPPLHYSRPVDSPEPLTPDRHNIHLDTLYEGTHVLPRLLPSTSDDLLHSKSFTLPQPSHHLLSLSIISSSTLSLLSPILPIFQSVYFSFVHIPRIR